MTITSRSARVRARAKLGRWQGAGTARAARVLCLLAGAGCAEPYPAAEPAGPGANRWLAACTSDDDCPALGECLHGLCTFACDLSSLEVCAAMNTDAVCDTSLGACDVPCGVALSCSVLASGYACEEDRCRAPDP
jgi:hypothetical protein